MRPATCTQDGPSRAARRPSPCARPPQSNPGDTKAKHSKPGRPRDGIALKQSAGIVGHSDKRPTSRPGSGHGGSSDHPADRRAQHPAARAQAEPRAASRAPPAPVSSTACAARSRRDLGASPPTCRPRPAATRRRRHPACSAAAPWRAASPSASRAGRRASACRSTRVEVEVQADFDARGELGMGDGIPAGYSEVRYVISIDSPAPRRGDRRAARAGPAPQPLSRRVRPGDAASRRRPPQRPGGLTAMHPRLQRRVQRYGWDRAAAAYEPSLAGAAGAGP